jgi:serine/threonine-protein kinase
MTPGVVPEMTPERWRRIKQILEDVLELPERERVRFLDRACDGDAELLREVASLAELDGRIGELFETPALAPRPASPATSDPTLDLSVPAAAVPGADPTGRRIGAYRVLRPLDPGGMGEVYLAERCDAYRQRVAVKVVPRGTANDELIRRFRRERQILADLEHPHIARLLDGGATADGRPYLVMEYVDGEPLDRYCDRRRLPIRARLELFLVVLEAVRHAHQHLVIHRDLKPGNILITAEGAPKLLDFGIAKLLEPEEEGDLRDPPTRPGGGPMTPNYASPEQLLGGPVTTASDVYSLGVLLYQLLTGRRPYDFALGPPREVSRKILHEAPEPPSAVVERTVEALDADGELTPVPPEAVSRARGTEPGRLRRRLAGDLDAVVLRALAKAPEDRYPSAEALADDLRNHLEYRPVTVRPARWPYLAGKFLRRHRLAFATVTLVLLLIAGFTVAVTVFWQRAVVERRQAEVATWLLDDLLRHFGPERSEGASVSKAAFLDDGRRRMERETAPASELREVVAAALALGYQDLGELGAARELLEEAVTIGRQRPGGDDVRLARALDDLGGVLYRLGEDGEAERLFREALALRHRLHGPGDHPEILSLLNNLATVRVRRGEHALAEEGYREVLEKKRRLTGEDSSYVRTLNNLAYVLAEQGKVVEAEELYRRGLELRLAFHGGRGHPEVVRSLLSLGTLLYERGELAEAEALLREVLAFRLEADGEEHPRVATVRHNLGLVLLATGRSREAEELLRQALDVRRATYGEDHPQVANARRSLAMALLARGRPAEGERLARQALETLRRRWTPGHWRIADAESVLGGCLTALGHLPEAEPLVTEGYSVLLRTRGAESIRTIHARRRLAELHRAAGRRGLEAAQTSSPPPPGP